MSRSDSLDDAAIEALLAGNGAGGELASLVAFVGELRNQASGPVPAPSPRLASMLELGFAPDGGGARAAADHAGGRGLRPAGVRRRGSGAARAAVAGVAAVIGLTAAGAAGALPGAAQDAVATAVEAVTPFQFPKEADDRAVTGKRESTGATEGGLEGPETADEVGGGGRGHGGGEGGGRPEAPGQGVLDRAGQAPAAGHAPPSVPAGGPGTAGAPAGAPAVDAPAAGVTVPPSTGAVPAPAEPTAPAVTLPPATATLTDGLTGGRRSLPGPAVSTVPTTIPDVGGLRP